MTVTPTNPPVVYFRTVIAKEDIDKYTYNPEAIVPQPQSMYADRKDAITWLVNNNKSRLQLMDNTPITTWTTTTLDNGNILLEGTK